ncbi:MAG: TRAP transporter substrate-binding protein DctP [Alphaproteobacteria bacterium]
MILIALVVALTGPSRALAGEKPLLRISTENTTAHVHTRVMLRFVEELKHRAGERLDIRLYHSAELFRDRDVISAIDQGKVEMAVPGTWQIERFVPDVAVFTLPMVYGRTRAEIDRLRDGDIGRIVDRRIERSLAIHVVGRWIDLGFLNIFSVRKPIRRHEDLAGLKVRIAGGESNSMRLEAFGAEAQVIPWPDLGAALDAGTVDGVLSSHATMASAELWTRGIRYAFEDREHFAQYVPLIAGDFWDRLPPDLKTTITDTWESIVELARGEAALAQTEARRLLIHHGVQVVTPGEATLSTWRKKLMTRQEDVVTRVGVDPGLVARVTAVLEGGK